MHWKGSCHLPTLTSQGSIVKHHWGYWMREQPTVFSVPGQGKVVEVVNNRLIRNESMIAMDERLHGQSLEEKKPITEQWAVSPIHYVGTDKLPAVRAEAALNKSKLTTTPWPYLKYSFLTSPSPASIKFHLLLIPAPLLSNLHGLRKHWISYSLGCYRKYIIDRLTPSKDVEFWI